MKELAYLQEFLVTSAAIEDLLDEDFLVWVGKLDKKREVR